MGNLTMAEGEDRAKEPATLAQELAAEEDRLRRRFVYHTRPKGPLTLDQAIALAASVSNGEL